MKVVATGTEHMRLDSVDTPSELITRFLKTATNLRFQFAEFLERFEMTEGRFAVLSALDQAGADGLSQAALAEQLLQSESNISSLIVRLQNKGLVDRSLSQKDRRKRVLLLTPAGQALVDQIEASRHRWADGICARISLADRQELISLLQQFPTRPNIRPLRQSSARPINRVGEDWLSPPASSEPEIDCVSPQSALERMLSSLGIVNQTGGEAG